MTGISHAADADALLRLNGLNRHLVFKVALHCRIANRYRRVRAQGNAPISVPTPLPL